MLKKMAFIVSILLSYAGYSQAQEVKHGRTNSWFLLLNSLQLTPTFSISNELHERTGAFLHDQGQLLIRPSLDCTLNPNVAFSLGYTFIRVWPYIPYNLPVVRNENNIWEQVTLKNEVGRVHFYHRLRQENRWVQHLTAENGITTLQGSDYSNRFRYRIGLTLDLLKFGTSNRALFFNVFNEFWFTQDEKLRPKDFARNWLYAGLGYRPDPATNVQIGYMHQYDKAGTTFIASPIVQFTLSKSFSLLP